MSYEDLITLLTHLDESEVAYIDYKTEAQHVILSKEVPLLNTNQESSQAVIEPNNQDSKNKVEEIKNTENVKSNEELTEEPTEKESEAVKAPMVGVVYLQPQPDEDPYVKVGDRVEQGDVICIVEAMKLMNEIQAPHGGIVTEIAVENEEVVEFNQPLLYIEP